MRTYCHLVASLLIASGLAGCHSAQPCGTGICNMGTAGCAVTQEAQAAHCQGCGQSDGCACDTSGHPGLLNRLAARHACNSCDSCPTSDCDSCDSCDSQCRVRLTDRLAAHHADNCGCDSCHSGRAGGMLQGHGQRCGSCGDMSGQCGCQAASRGMLTGMRMGGCATCGDQTGSCGCGGIGHGGLLGQGNRLAGGACADGSCGVMQAGLRGCQLQGCGMNGCGFGGYICDGCRARGFCRCGACNAFRMGRGNGYGRGYTPNSELMGQGPVTPTYNYPYYTVRGPRDFLMDACGAPPIVPSNPRPMCLPSIGW